MIIEKSDSGFRAIVPCKINLFLEVLGRREDGYHDLDTVMLAISLCDELEIRPRDDSLLTLEVVVPTDEEQVLKAEDPAWHIPADSSNLIIKAMDRMRRAIGRPDAGAHVRLLKRIPAQAGLGGGSADAAAALVLSSLLWQGVYDSQISHHIASELGSDINFFLEGWNGAQWLARCGGRGEQIQPLDSTQLLHFVVAHPPAGCNTGQVFQNLRLSRKDEEVSRAPDEMIQSLQRGTIRSETLSLFNRLQNAAESVTPWIDRLSKRFDRYDPLAHCLSGSGSARFCLCSSAQQAEKIKNELRLHRDMRVYTASTWFTSSIEQQVQGLSYRS